MNPITFIWRRLIFNDLDNDGGSVEVTQEINAEYEALFAILSKKLVKGLTIDDIKIKSASYDNGKSHSYC